MTTKALSPQSNLAQTTEQNLSPKSVEAVLLKGDLSGLTVEQRVVYYKTVCDEIGLNFKTQPFEYITLNGRLTLYATKRCTDQLRTLRGISIEEIGVVPAGDGIYCISAKAKDPSGRFDSDIGAVSIKGLSGDSLANSMKKAVTQAKRRVTLSICGLGMLDETETDQIKDAVKVDIEYAHDPEAINANAEVPASASPTRLMHTPPDEDASDYILSVEEKIGRSGAAYFSIQTSSSRYDENGFGERLVRWATTFEAATAANADAFCRNGTPVKVVFKPSNKLDSKGNPYLNIQSIVEVDPDTNNERVYSQGDEEIPF